ncbi:hypothetical protein GCM10023091_37010 [Ravibacter arvi]|uniref:DNA-binding response regulator n=1 Tax=Ravibacter arvi TaxID=2051041 RepID=A0ABP8M8X5_9BACT
MEQRILLVDDDQELIDFLKLLLMRQYHIMEASNATEAMEILLQYPVDLIVSDVVMPGINGFEFCVMVKRNVQLCNIPVILLTSKNTVQSKIEGLEFGADAYIEKPFDTTALKAQIINLLDNRERLKAFFVNQQTNQARSSGRMSADAAWVERVSELIIKRVDKQELKLEYLAEAMNMSSMTFRRRLKKFAGTTPQEFIKRIRLKHAAELLSSGRYKVYEVAMRVGYKSQSHFGKHFYHEFGVKPGRFAASDRSSQP